MKKILITLLAVWMLALSLFANFVFNSEKIINAFAGGSGNNIAGIIETEEKQYCSATLDDNFADDTIIITLNKQASLNFKEYTINDFQEAKFSEINNLAKYTEQVVETQISKKTANNAIAKNDSLNDESITLNTDEFRKTLRLTLEEKGKENVLSTIKSLEKRKDVIIAGPAYMLSECATPSDSFYEMYQWAPKKISMPSAWDITHGSFVKVGVLDSGINSSHEDLSNQVNTNLSCDFSGDATSGLVDSNGHGTHVAGIIGAKANNTKGIAGINWDISLVSLRIQNSKNYSDTSMLCAAIDYASANKIRILNCSFGYYDSPDLNLKYKISKFDGLFVAAAGNNNKNTDLADNMYYPSSFDLPNLISVGASNSDDKRSNWNSLDNLWGLINGDQQSNYGQTTVDVFAPGTSIVSTVPFQYEILPDFVLYPYYKMKSGTSMAAPHVAGVAALILSKYPELSASQIKQAIINGVDYVPALFNLCTSGGRLNAYKALVAAANPPAVATASGDYDCDGLDDIAVLYGYPSYSYSRASISVFWGNNPSHPVQVWESNIFNAYAVVGMVAGDINGDSYCDIIVHYNDNYSPPRMFVWYGHQALNNYNLVSSYNIASDAKMVKIVSGDFNNDGMADVAVLYGYPDYSYSRATISVFWGNNPSNPVQVWESNIFNAYAVVGISAGDINGDSHCDIIIHYNDNYNPPRMFVWYGHQSLNNYNLVSTYLNPANAYIVSTISGDFNHDGHDDVAVLYGYPSYSYSRATISVFWGNNPSNPVQVWESNIFNAYAVVGISAGDINGDSYCDIIALYDDNYYPQRMFAWYGHESLNGLHTIWSA